MGRGGWKVYVQWSQSGASPSRRSTIVSSSAGLGTSGAPPPSSVGLATAMSSPRKLSLAARDHEVDAVEHLDPAVRGADVAELEEGRGFGGGHPGAPGSWPR